MNIFESTRDSRLDMGDVYFWTATINNWQHLLKSDDMKLIIMDSLLWLKGKKLITVYGYVIMPNHLHLIWQILGKNGKESPQGSFLKFTAHTFKKKLREQDPALLNSYAVNAVNKDFEFWQRDPLGIRLFSRQVTMQKLEYSHNNPVAERWKLCPTPETYRFSSASYYNDGQDEFGLLTNIAEVL